MTCQHLPALYNQGVSGAGAWGIARSSIIVYCTAYCTKKGTGSLSFSHSEGRIYQLSAVETNRLHPLSKWLVYL